LRLNCLRQGKFVKPLEGRVEEGTQTKTDNFNQGENVLQPLKFLDGELTRRRVSIVKLHG
jgi:hypothetical protein